MYVAPWSPWRPWGCGCCGTCPTCGGSGVVPRPFIVPVVPMIPVRPRPLGFVPRGPLVPGFEPSRGAARDRRAALV